MPSSTRLQELLKQWQESRQQGCGLTAEQLCHDCPELVPILRQHIVALQGQAAATPTFEPPICVDAVTIDQEGNGAGPAISDMTTADAEALPTRAGRYLIEGQIGEGGMG